MKSFPAHLLFFVFLSASPFITLISSEADQRFKRESLPYFQSDLFLEHRNTEYFEAKGVHNRNKILQTVHHGILLNWIDPVVAPKVPGVSDFDRITIVGGRQRVLVQQFENWFRVNANFDDEIWHSFADRLVAMSIYYMHKSIDCFQMPINDFDDQRLILLQRFYARIDLYEGMVGLLTSVIDTQHKDDQIFRRSSLIRSLRSSLELVEADIKKINIIAEDNSWVMPGRLRETVFATRLNKAIALIHRLENPRAEGNGESPSEEP